MRSSLLIKPRKQIKFCMSLRNLPTETPDFLLTVFHRADNEVSSCCHSLKTGSQGHHSSAVSATSSKSMSAMSLFCADEIMNSSVMNRFTAGSRKIWLKASKFGYSSLGINVPRQHWSKKSRMASIFN